MDSIVERPNQFSTDFVNDANNQGVPHEEGSFCIRRPRRVVVWEHVEPLKFNGCESADPFVFLQAQTLSNRLMFIVSKFEIIIR